MIKFKSNGSIICHQQGHAQIIYLIKDESGVSDKLVFEFLELMTPNEGDMKHALARA